jgi:hypothetical protein
MAIKNSGRHDAREWIKKWLTNLLGLKGIVKAQAGE